MGTILREAGLRVYIPVDDHPPAHVHVRGDGFAKIQLEGPDGRPTFIVSRGMTVAEERKAFALVVKHRDALLRAWRATHG